jgi:hypothetical protein
MITHRIGRWESIRAKEISKISTRILCLHCASFVISADDSQASIRKDERRSRRSTSNFFNIYIGHSLFYAQFWPVSVLEDQFKDNQEEGASISPN